MMHPRLARSFKALGLASITIAAQGSGAAAPTTAESAASSSVAAGSPPSSTIVTPAIRPLREALAGPIDAARERFGIPAISLTLVRGNQVLWAEGFGSADLDRGRPASADTIYRAGSLAKPFTALAVLELEAAGRIDIDQPLAAELNAFRIRSRFDTRGNPITPRALLSHHAGLPSDLNKGLWSETPFTAVTTLLRDELTAFPPQLVFSYSNVGYSLLGHLVQQVAGRPFERHMEQTLFAPLGMTSTRFAQHPSHAEERAVGHRDGRPFEALPIRDVPAHGLETTAHDLGRFITAVLGGGELEGQQVLSPDRIEAMLTPQNDDVALDMDLVTGLGWFLEEGTIAGAGPVVRHGGTMLGFSAELVLLPEEGVGVAVLASSGGARRVVEQLAESILSQSISLMPEPLPPDLFVTAGAEAPASGTPISPSGHFATDLGLISIADEKGKRRSLCACMTNETMDLIPYPSGWLGVDPDQVGTLPPAVRPLAQMRYQTRQIDGRDVVVADTGDGEVVLGEKLPAEPIPAAWMQRLGRYEIINPDPGFPLQDLTLSLNDGKVCLGYRMPVLSSKRIQMPVRPVDEDSGIIVGLGRSRGDTLRFVGHGKDDEPLLRWSGYLARPVDH